MIKSVDRYPYIKFSNINIKKIQHIVSILLIFTILSTLILGSATSNWNVYGQPNETNSQTEKVIPSIPHTSQEGITESTNEQPTSETGSAENRSDVINDEQDIAGGSNTLSGSSDSQPDEDCLFDPSLPKCAPDENGKCPEGFNLNEDGQCFPEHDECPDGYHSADDDETGRCIPNSDGCPSGMIFRPEMKTCGYKEDVCRTYPYLADCKVDEGGNGGSNNLAYNSGYTHGCSDAKISDPSKRYINQAGKGPNYHTPEFMSGYNDGFEICSNGSNQPPSNSKGTFKVIVEVTNQLPRDTYGGITVSVVHFPENIFKPVYGVYFPAGQTVSKTFTFKSSDVPIGIEFEVNLDYGDDYNQYIFGKNSPAEKPEVVQFFIS